MDQLDQCKKKISLLKEKIIEVGKLLTQCDEYKAENRQLKEKQAEYHAHLKKLYDQYVKLFAEKQQLETELGLSREEVSRALSKTQAAELDAERLQQLVRVYQNEREEYGVEKLDRSQKNVGRLVRFVMQSRKDTTNGWAKPKPLPSWFHSILKSEMKRPNRCSAPSTPSLAWSTCSSPFPSSESGFDSTRSSPSHSSETPSPPLPPLFNLPVIEPSQQVTSPGSESGFESSEPSPCLPTLFDPPVIRPVSIALQVTGPGSDPSVQSKDPTVQICEDHSTPILEDRTVKIAEDFAIQDSKDPYTQVCTGPSVCKNTSIQSCEDLSIQACTDPTVQICEDHSTPILEDPTVEIAEDFAIQDSKDPLTQVCTGPSVCKNTSIQSCEDLSIQACTDPTVQICEDHSTPILEDPTVKITEDLAIKDAKDPSVSKDPTMQICEDPTIQAFMDPTGKITEDLAIMDATDPSVYKDPTVQICEDLTIQTCSDPSVQVKDPTVQICEELSIQILENPIAKISEDPAIQNLKDFSTPQQGSLNPANWVTQDPDTIPDSVTGEIFKLFHPFNVPLLSPIKSKPNRVKNRSKPKVTPLPTNSALQNVSQIPSLSGVELSNVDKRLELLFELERRRKKRTLRKARRTFRKESWVVEEIKPKKIKGEGRIVKKRNRRNVQKKKEVRDCGAETCGAAAVSNSTTSLGGLLQDMARDSPMSSPRDEPENDSPPPPLRSQDQGIDSLPQRTQSRTQKIDLTTQVDQSRSEDSVSLTLTIKTPNKECFSSTNAIQLKNDKIDALIQAILSLTGNGTCAIPKQDQETETSPQVIQSQKQECLSRTLVQNQEDYSPTQAVYLKDHEFDPRSQLMQSLSRESGSSSQVMKSANRENNVPESQNELSDSPNQAILFQNQEMDSFTDTIQPQNEERKSANQNVESQNQASDLLSEMVQSQNQLSDSPNQAILFQNQEMDSFTDTIQPQNEERKLANQNVESLNQASDLLSEMVQSQNQLGDSPNHAIWFQNQEMDSFTDTIQPQNEERKLANQNVESLNQASDLLSEMVQSQNQLGDSPNHAIWFQNQEMDSFTDTIQPQNEERKLANQNVESLNQASDLLSEMVQSQNQLSDSPNHAIWFQNQEMDSFTDTIQPQNEERKSANQNVESQNQASDLLSEMVQSQNQLSDSPNQAILFQNQEMDSFTDTIQPQNEERKLANQNVESLNQASDLLSEMVQSQNQLSDSPNQAIWFQNQEMDSFTDTIQPQNEERKLANQNVESLNQASDLLSEMVQSQNQLSDSPNHAIWFQNQEMDSFTDTIQPQNEERKSANQKVESQNQASDLLSEMVQSQNQLSDSPNQAILFQNQEMDSFTDTIQPQNEERKLANQNVESLNQASDLLSEMVQSQNQLSDSPNQAIWFQNQEMDSFTDTIQHQNEERKSANQNVESQNQASDLISELVQSQNQLSDSPNQAIWFQNQEMDSYNETVQPQNEERKSANQNVESQNQACDLLSEMLQSQNTLSDSCQAVQSQYYENEGSQEREIDLPAQPIQPDQYENDEFLQTLQSQNRGSDPEALGRLSLPLCLPETIHRRPVARKQGKGLPERRSPREPCAPVPEKTFDDDLVTTRGPSPKRRRLDVSDDSEIRENVSEVRVTLLTAETKTAEVEGNRTKRERYPPARRPLTRSIGSIRDGEEKMLLPEPVKQRHRKSVSTCGTSEDSTRTKIRDEDEEIPNEQGSSPTGSVRTTRRSSKVSTGSTDERNMLAEPVTPKQKQKRSRSTSGKFEDSPQTKRCDQEMPNEEGSSPMGSVRTTRRSAKISTGSTDERNLLAEPVTPKQKQKRSRSTSGKFEDSPQTKRCDQEMPNEEGSSPMGSVRTTRRSAKISTGSTDERNLLAEPVTPKQKQRRSRSMSGKFEDSPQAKRCDQEMPNEEGSSPTGSVRTTRRSTKISTGSTDERNLLAEPVTPKQKQRRSRSTSGKFEDSPQAKRCDEEIPNKEASSPGESVRTTRRSSKVSTGSTDERNLLAEPVTPKQNNRTSLSTCGTIEDSTYTKICDEDEEIHNEEGSSPTESVRSTRRSLKVSTWSTDERNLLAEPVTPKQKHRRSRSTCGTFEDSAYAKICDKDEEIPNKEGSSPTESVRTTKSSSKVSAGSIFDERILLTEPVTPKQKHRGSESTCGTSEDSTYTKICDKDEEIPNEEVSSPVESVESVRKTRRSSKISRGSICDPEEPILAAELVTPKQKHRRSVSTCEKFEESPQVIRCDEEIPNEEASSPVESVRTTRRSSKLLRMVNDFEQKITTGEKSADQTAVCLTADNRLSVDIEGKEAAECSTSAQASNMLRTHTTRRKPIRVEEILPKKSMKEPKRQEKQPLTLLLDQWHNVSKDKEESPSYPMNSEEPPSIPVDSEEPPSIPVDSEEPPSIPVDSEEPSSIPVDSEEPPSIPVDSEEPSSIPVDSEEPPSFPMYAKELPPSPVYTEEPPSFPVEIEEPPSFPVETEEAPSFPMDSEEAPSSSVDAGEPPSFQSKYTLSQIQPNRDDVVLNENDVKESWAFYKQLRSRKRPAPTSPKRQKREVVETAKVTQVAPKPIRNELELEPIKARQLISDRPTQNLDVGAMWEKTKMLKMKKCVLASQNLGIVNPVPVIEHSVTEHISTPSQGTPSTQNNEKTNMKKRVRASRNLITVTPVSEPSVTEPISTKQSLVYSTRTGVSSQSGVGSQNDLLDNIMAAMEKPPEVRKPVLLVPPAESGKKKKKKNKGKKKQKKKTELPVVDLPPPTYSCPAEELAAKALEEFLAAKTATEAQAAVRIKACLTALTPIPGNLLIKRIVGIVVENVDEELDLRFTPPAPPLTPTQQRLFALFSSSPRFPPLFPPLLQAVRDVILPEKFIWPDDTLESCGRFYAALCRKTDEAKRALKLCVDCAAGMKQRGCIIINAVLAAWPEVLALAAKAEPWGPGPTLALLVMNTSPSKKRSSQAESLQALKKLLDGYYGYSREVDISAWARKAVAAVRGGSTNAGLAVGAVSANQGWKWAATAVVAPLLETLGVWQFGALPDATALLVINVLSRVLDLFPDNIQDGVMTKIEAVDRLAEILLSGKVSHEGEEAIVELVMDISKPTEKLFSLLSRWRPRSAVTHLVLKRLQTVLARCSRKRKIATELPAEQLATKRAPKMPPRK